MAAYAACLSATSTKESPWHVIPADDKRNARLIVSELVIGAFSELKMSYPEPSTKREGELAAIRKALME